MLLQPKMKWNLMKESSQSNVEDLVRLMNIEPLTAKLLVQRGLDTAEEAQEFFNGENEIHDPFLFEDMEKAVLRIKSAIERKEKICIFGDYDADGVTSTSVVLLAIRELGGEAEFYIPNRFREGYGLNEVAVRHINEQGCSLMITVDTGISGVAEVDVANELGMDVIITDHHEVSPTVPNAYAIIHPKIEGTTYPFHELAGVGVAFKLAHGLLGYYPKHLLDLVVIGTIADLVPLSGENRTIAKEGLKALRQTKRVGLKALYEVAGIEQSSITEQEVGFSIGPRMNAVGRLGDADPAAQLLLTEDADEARELANFMQEVNKERQEVVQAITKEAIHEIESNQDIHGGKALVVAKEGWNAGVIGIVASRLVSEYSRPVIVLGIDAEKKIAKGSGRSISGFDLFANLSDCRDILPHFGGHPMAAGMTLGMEDVDELRRRLNELAEEQLKEEDLVPVAEVDTECEIQDITMKALEELGMLAPFGVGNPKPLLAIQNIKATGMRQIGGNSTHLKLILTNNRESLDAIGFGMGFVFEHMSQEPVVSVLGEASINEWNNIRKPQLMLKDISINQWQLFDIRGKRDIIKYANTLNQDICVISFQKEMTLSGYEGEIKYFDEEIDILNKNVFFIGLPSSMEEISHLFEKGFPKRIYAGFSSHSSEMFKAVPTREDFKTYYGLIRQYGPFSLVEYSEKIRMWKDWSKETISFMTQVFFELNFVTIENGIICLKQTGEKKDFSASPTYQKKQNQLQVEQELLYSSYSQLKEWFERLNA